MKKQVKKLCSESVNALKRTNKTSEEKFNKVLEKIKAFCKVAYQLYVKTTQPDQPIEQARVFESKPPNEFKDLNKAA